MSQAQVEVFKQADGRHRWVLISSSAYRDRDREIVSTKALADDCERADGDGNYGPLRWWHVKGLDIGDCDYNAMHGRLLIESGTFRDAQVAEAVKAQGGALSASIGFKHPVTQPDADGVFHKIERFERSLLPRGAASNLFAAIGAVTKEFDMTDTKIDALKELVGDDVAASIIAQADTTQKAADAAGVTFKGKRAPATAQTTKEMPAFIKDKIEAAEDDAEAEDDEEDDEEAEGEGEGDEPKKKATPAPATKARRTKAAAAPALPTPSGLQATVGAMTVSEFGAAMATAFKEAYAPLIESIKEFGVANAELAKRVEELEGDVPAGAKAYVASKSAGVGAALAEAMKEAGQRPASSIDQITEWLMAK